jgi:hypothetical protein
MLMLWCWILDVDVFILLWWYYHWLSALVVSWCRNMRLYSVKSLPKVRLGGHCLLLLNWGGPVFDHMADNGRLLTGCCHAASNDSNHAYIFVSRKHVADVMMMIWSPPFSLLFCDTVDTMTKAHFLGQLRPYKRFIGLWMLAVFELDNDKWIE